MSWILKLLGVDPIGRIADALNTAYQAKLAAKNDADRVAADVAIQKLHAALEERKLRSGVVLEGMQHKAFWVPWLIASVPASIWFGWGVLDSAINNGATLPDVSELPPQLQKYFDIVWQNIFYSGAGVAGATAIAKAIGRR
jgi:hypothetical protein